MKRTAFFALIAAGGLTLSGCSGAPDAPAESVEEPQEVTAPGSPTDEPGDDRTDAGGPPEDETGEFSPRDVRAQEFGLDHEQAVALAVETAGAGFTFSVDLDYSSYREAWRYEIEVFDGTTAHDIEIDAMTGEVIDHERESEDDPEREIHFDMTPAEAIELAAAHMSADGIVEGWQLEWDDGRLEYDIDIESGEDLVVDVESGEVRED